MALPPSQLTALLSKLNYLPGGQPGGINPGARFLLLDPVRDSAFLALPSIKNPTAPVNDGGLGVVDNGLFVYTSAYVPGTTKKRQYPVKFFWIGSPAGTTDANDVFSIYVADVNQAAYFPGAPASSWLVNPRLALSVTQAKSDIVAWFNNNYPFTSVPPVGGVGQETPAGQTNAAYGTLSTGGNPGNVSGMTSIDGQFWPIYDYVDGSCILYFSIKTPNINTKSIYAYKTAANEGMEFQAPAGAAQFVGGLVGINQLSGGTAWNTNSVPGRSAGGAMSSHRFSMLSPDPLNLSVRVAGQQSAVFAYAGGVVDNSSPDHGAGLLMSRVPDIHAAPLTASNAVTSESIGFPFDDGAVSNPDKLGSIFPAPPTGQAAAGYGMIYNAVSAPRDLRGTSAVVISAMQIRVAYWVPGSNNLPIYLGSDPILATVDPVVTGTCRPQFTYLPDGVPKLTYANFSLDQNLVLAVQYLPWDALFPGRQKRLFTYMSGQQAPEVIYTWGKRKVRLFLWWGFNSFSYSSDPSVVNHWLEIWELGGAGFDILANQSHKWQAVVHLNQFNEQGFDEIISPKAVDVEIEATSDAIAVTGPGFGSLRVGNVIIED